MSIAHLDRHPTYLLAGLLALALARGGPAAAAEAPRYAEEVAPLLKAHCVKCHGPVKAEAGLNLATPAAVARGGENGPIVAPHDPVESLLWERIEADEMPPKHPLDPADKDLIRRWIEAGAPGLPAPAQAGDPDDHWAFQPLRSPPAPAVADALRVLGPLDRFVQARLEAAGASLAPEAPRRTLIRRVSLIATGLPPTPEEVDAYLADQSPDAHARMVERYLASPHYGERWGKIWLDAAGYADSNGYFQADTDRPFAYRYRDYVVRSMNADKPFDAFVVEQIAGDELVDFQPGQAATPDVVEKLVATHYLRNGQDGSGESDGNPDELRVDRYAALESCQQIVATSLMGLTLHCAKCHAHKFEPITHEDYYRFQAIFDPVFPAAHEKLWVKPQQRTVLAPAPGEREAWEAKLREAEAESTRLRDELTAWSRDNRPRGEVVFADDFDAGPLAPRWSNTAPGDHAPGGATPVTVDGEAAPAARAREGRLEIVAGAATGDRWISTAQSFDWTPEPVGASIQLTFDLVDVKLAPEGTPAERVGYFIATHDFDDSGERSGGNILVDGNPGGATTVYLDYPGADSKNLQAIGATGYAPGRNYGVRVTYDGRGKYRLEHLVDGLPESGSLTLGPDDLPDGGVGFEYLAGRSFVVDAVRVERLPAPDQPGGSERARFEEELKARRQRSDEVAKAAGELKDNPPGRLAWATDVSPTPPETHLLTRGSYAQPADAMEPGPIAALVDSAEAFRIEPRSGSARTTGRRLAFARWLTRPGSRVAALMARVQVNRFWQHHFGAGLVETPENLGLSGAPPADPELLDWLADRFVRSGWSQKHVHRLILNSASFRQATAAPDADAPALPPGIPRGYPVQRLDAESIRDAMLAVGGDLDRTMGGPYIPIRVDGNGEIQVPEDQPGSRRRSLYLQQRRTQVPTLLQVFDAPSIVFNSVRRPRTAMPLQALALLNSDFVLARAKAFAARLEAGSADDAGRVRLAYRLAFAREPGAVELASALAFLDEQSRGRAAEPEPRRAAWRDLTQVLLASNPFLYIE